MGAAKEASIYQRKQLIAKKQTGGSEERMARMEERRRIVIEEISGGRAAKSKPQRHEKAKGSVSEHQYQQQKQSIKASEKQSLKSHHRLAGGEGESRSW